MGWIESLFNSKHASANPLDDFLKAIDDKHEVTFDYQGAKDPAPQTRTVIPVRKEGPHIIAFDPARENEFDDGYRKFNPKNISTVHSTRPRSVEPPAEKPKDGPTTYVPQEFAPEGTYPKPKPFGAPVEQPVVQQDEQPVTTLRPSEPVGRQPKAWEERDKYKDWLLESQSKPWQSDDDRRMPREYNVIPTLEEYKDARASDFDPDTFDKATYKRLRNMPGVTHQNIKDALESGIPVEDYETARINNPDSHSSAKDEALKYQDYYDRMMLKNRMQHLSAQGRRYSGVDLLNPQDHLSLVRNLMFHHGSLKNAPSFEEPYSDTPWRRRANRWLMSECGKLEPSQKKYIKVDDLYDENSIMNPDEYDDTISKLIKHHTVKQMNAVSLNDYMKSSRIINALSNIGSSKFLPTLYTHDKYEE